MVSTSCLFRHVSYGQETLATSQALLRLWGSQMWALGESGPPQQHCHSLWPEINPMISPQYTVTHPLVCTVSLCTLPLLSALEIPRTAHKQHTRRPLCGVEGSDCACPPEPPQKV